MSQLHGQQRVVNNHLLSQMFMSSAGRTINSWILHCLHNLRTVLVFFFFFELAANCCLLLLNLPVVGCSQNMLSERRCLISSLHLTPFIKAVDSELLLPLLPSQRWNNFGPLLDLWNVYRRWHMKDPHWTGSAKGVTVVLQFQTRMDFFVRQCYFVGHYPSNLCHSICCCNIIKLSIRT